MKIAGENLTIAGLAKAGGVGVETIRYYHRRGLLAQPPRAGAIRRYGGDAVRRLRFIRDSQAAGFTLEEIAELLALDASHDHCRARQLATARIEALDARIADLKRARAALARLATACAGAEAEAAPCPILAAYDP